MNALETPLELPPAREDSGRKIVIAGSIRQGRNKLPLIFVVFGEATLWSTCALQKLSGIEKAFACHILLDGDT